MGLIKIVWAKDCADLHKFEQVFCKAVRVP